MSNYKKHSYSCKPGVKNSTGETNKEINDDRYIYVDSLGNEYKLHTHKLDNKDCELDKLTECITDQVLKALRGD